MTLSIPILENHRAALESWIWSLFMEMKFSLKFSYFFQKSGGNLNSLWEQGKSINRTSSVFFGNCRRELSRSFWMISNRWYYLIACNSLEGFPFSNSFLYLLWTLHLFPARNIWLRQDCISNNIDL